MFLPFRVECYHDKDALSCRAHPKTIEIHPTTLRFVLLPTTVANTQTETQEKIFLAETFG